LWFSFDGKERPALTDSTVLSKLSEISLFCGVSSFSRFLARSFWEVLFRRASKVQSKVQINMSVKSRTYLGDGKGGIQTPCNSPL